MHSGQLIGVEALSRWAHAEFGAIRPEEFIALAEMGDLIRDLTLEVLRQAAQAWRLLDAQGVGVPVSVNLSPYMLQDVRWADEILETLAQTEMPMHSLELEVTENAFVHDAEQALQAMRKLEKVGVRFSLDDFGIGYSSMEHLASMPIHSLKIDRSFVAGVVDNPKSRAIVHSALLLGSELGLSVIAEGVESEAHAQALLAMGCVFAQGYYYGMPNELAALLADLAHKASGPRG